MKHPRMDGHLAAEEMVRWSYDLPDLQAKDRGRSWLVRARDLVRDGWAKVKALLVEPEPLETGFDPFEGLPQTQFPTAFKRNTYENHAPERPKYIESPKPAPKDKTTKRDL